MGLSVIGQSFRHPPDEESSASETDGVRATRKNALPADRSTAGMTAGALTGGGLTVMANAPNPAGFSILKDHFHDEAIHPVGLLFGALPPTIVAMLAFLLL